MEDYKIKNVELFNELDNLICEVEDERLLNKNKKIKYYIETWGAVESGNLPELAYEEFDNEETLNELIAIMKSMLEK